MKFSLFFLCCCISGLLFSQDTSIIQTFTFDSSSRRAVFEFPDEGGQYEKIVMQYRMRCKNALVSDGNDRNKGCGEWDYSCNTYITDSSSIDSILRFTNHYIFPPSISGSIFNVSYSIPYDIFQKNDIKTQGDFTNTISRPLVLGQNLESILNQNSNRNALIFQLSDDLVQEFIDNDESFEGIDLLPNQSFSSEFVEVQIGYTDLDFEFRTINWETVYSGKLEAEAGLPLFIPFNKAELIPSNATPWIKIIIKSKEEISLAAGSPSAKVFNLQSDNEYAEFSGSNYYQSDFPGIGGSEPRTIDAWINTKEVNGEICSWGRNGSGEKWVVRVNDNGTLRVEINGGYAFGSTPLNDGEWHHIAVVWDKSNSINRAQLYVDGQLDPLSGAQSRGVNTFIGEGATPVRISRGINNRYWVGGIDEVRIFDKALSESEIQEIMNRINFSNSTLQQNLVMQYSFNQNLSDGAGNSSELVENGPCNTTSYISNTNASMNLEEGVVPFLGLVSSSELINRDNDTLGFILDSIAASPDIIIERIINQNSGTLQDDEIVDLAPQFVYDQSKSTTIYNPEGEIIDEIQLPRDSVFINSELEYFIRRPTALEIMSFVTPYGIGLDLGAEGKMWEFDLSDFSPILTGTKELYLTRGGEFQEEMDIKFLFIEGTPEREVLSVNQIWRTEQRNYQDIISEKAFEPRTIQVPEGTKHAKIRSVITGHGQEGEFIRRRHTVRVNETEQVFNWFVWTECSENPIYPQGGTWVFDRAGWCPGQASDIQEWEVTESIQNGEITIDYDISTADGDSRYIVSHQLICYGDYSNEIDADLIILSPSMKTEEDRKNSSCSEPRVRIKNRGSEPLTSAKIEYQAEGDELLSYEWKGLVEPGKSVDITLPLNSNPWYFRNAVRSEGATEFGKFNVAISNLNSEDVLIQRTTEYEIAPTLPGEVEITYKTNDVGFEYDFTVTRVLDSMVLIEESNLLGDTQYQDTVGGDFNGCAVFQWNDSGEDGLDFFYWDAIGDPRGTGYLRIKSTRNSKTITLNPDYGKYQYLEFYTTDITSIDESNNKILVYPNPTNSTIWIKDQENSIERIQILNIQGQVLFQSELNDTSIQIDMRKYANGMYQIIAFKKNGKTVQNTVIKQ